MPNISIHAPRVGSDRNTVVVNRAGNNFNPRSPCGERHLDDEELKSKIRISIHAPRVGSDAFRKWKTVLQGRFQSTLPVWGATVQLCTLSTCDRFQSTLPVWGATYVGSSSIPARAFQSTLPVWGATGAEKERRRITKDFNPRSPCGERLCPMYIPASLHAFQSTLPVWGATRIQ